MDMESAFDMLSDDPSGMGLKQIREERNHRHEEDETFMSYAGEPTETQYVEPICSDAINEAVAEDDLSIVNMEGTLTESTTRKDKTFAFKAPPEYASILSGSSVEAANLANNHSYDYGEQSYTDTVEALENAGVVTFGYENVKILKSRMYHPSL